MKPKTQMRIAVLVAVLFIVAVVCECIRNILPMHLSPASFLILITLWSPIFLIPVIYIFGIIRRKLKTVQVAYRVWWILAVVLLSMDIGLLIGVEGALSRRSLIEFWNLGVRFGCVTLALLVGLKGLERTIEAENRLNEENTSTAEKVR